jgi:hypothetical protein
MPVQGSSRQLHDGKWFKIRHVDSSNIQWVGWPESGEPLMLVKYRANDIYGYLGVTRQRVVAAANAKSTGEYINRRIKPHFKFVKLAA